MILIDNAIKHMREIAKSKRSIKKMCTDDCNQCIPPTCAESVEEYEQIADWLEELKILRKAYDRACRNIAAYCNKYEYSCFLCPYHDIDGDDCGKNNIISPDDEYYCSKYDWWKEQLIKEVKEND